MLAKGERSGTFYPFWDVITGLIEDNRAPKLVAIENVCGTLTSHGGKDFEAKLRFLEALEPGIGALPGTSLAAGLSAAAELMPPGTSAGKQVVVLVEIKARFDEESNIGWARALESDGVHVIYGLLGLKTHSKIALDVRREGDRLARYVHLSTGNYNAVTAAAYTDLGLLTADPDIGEDATQLFNYLTGYAHPKEFRRLLVAPVNLRERLVELIEREAAHARAGRGGHLVLKMNALSDDRMIEVLVRAAQAGVKTDLLVRGICSLRPGVPGVTENVRVTSIVGRFLEHSRIFWFRNGGAEEVYLGSADLMRRNLSRRVEVLFPVRDEGLVRHLKDVVLGAYLADNVRARHMRSDGGYDRVRPREGEAAIDAQARLLGTPTPAGDDDLD